MALEVRIEGAATLHKVAAQMRAEGRKDLSGEMGRALSGAAEPLKEEIRTQGEAAMPSENGYRALFSKSLQFRLQRRNGGQSASVKLITYADGKKERRDIGSLERGNLRHPLWGNRRKWYTTEIRGGWHKRATADAMDKAQDRMVKVITDYADRLIK